ncbi:glycoside hydrolase family 68 protein [Sphingopyxis sp.]|uniref:glycoside hydrolase family 68 protein n=1 Tax=Sphingopyxis sp. TaxID=1908224 RepID=UPI003F729C28
MPPSHSATTGIETLHWRVAADRTIEAAAHARIPVLRAADVRRAASDLDIWDAWPLADVAGQPVQWRGGELWFALAAPVAPNPEQRHFAARIHHFHRRADAFHHLGPTLPAGLSTGSREWSGSARLEGGKVHLYFTAAGRRGEALPSYLQRLFVTSSTLSDQDDAVFGRWSAPRELLAPGGPYLDADAPDGRLGEIKAFRDPFAWRSAAGDEYLLFTASSARDRGAHNGLVGLALAEADGGYRALPPLVDATGTNNELERPHIVAHGSRLYLFWSTQAKVFAPGITAPTGLYGAVADRIGGPWMLLNDHGLVLANPLREPFQAYSWWVLPDLSVASFVDYWGVDDATASSKPLGRSQFGGAFAPFLHLDLDGARAGLKQSGR